MSSYDAVIWDWNGTLLDDVDLCLSIANELLAEIGVPALTRNRYKQIFDFPVRLYWERAGVDLSTVDFHAVSGRFCELFERRLHDAKLHPGANEILQSTRAAGMSQFILSGTEHAALERLVAHYEVAEHFDAVQGMPNTLADGKLSAGAALMSSVSLDPGTTVLVGDTTHDADVARDLGVDCVLVASGHQSAARLADQGCPVIDSLADLPAIIGQP